MLVTAMSVAVEGCSIIHKAESRRRQFLRRGGCVVIRNFLSEVVGFLVVVR